MSQEERIELLEKELSKLRSDFSEIVHISQLLGGQARMFHSAVTALIVSHPNPNVLRPILEEHLMRLDADVVATSNSDDHYSAVQAAQELLMFALNESVMRLHNSHS